MYMCVLPPCLSTTCVWYPRMSKENIRAPETGLWVVLKPLCGCLELNLGLLQEQQELLIAELSLQPKFLNF